MLPMLALSLLLNLPAAVSAGSSTDITYMVIMIDSGVILKRYRLDAEAIGGALFSGDRIVVVTEGRNEFGPVPVYIKE